MTAQYDAKNTGVRLGSIKKDKGFEVHPEDIKKVLDGGEVYMATKVNNEGSDKVKVLC